MAAGATRTMRLKKDADIIGFLRKVRTCDSEVFFEDQENRLDLKSALSQYVFVTLAQRVDLLESGQISCAGAEDYAVLAEYIENR